MSILLESLSQDNKPPNNNVPDIHSTHFDDEMLGDEWLIKRVKVWRLASAVLLIVLVASWLFFYLQLSSSSFQAETVGHEALIVTDVPKKQQQLVESSVVENQPVLEEKLLEEQRPIEKASPNSKMVNKNEFTMQNYAPQKRENSSKSVSAADVNISSPSVKSVAASKVKSGDNSAVGTALLVNELSEDLQSKFPKIEINSYVVADSAKDSFVILDGGFYKIDQVIAPDLILRKIANQEIVVEFHSQLVKIPLN